MRDSVATGLERHPAAVERMETTLQNAAGWQPITPGVCDALSPEVRHWIGIRTSVSAEIEAVTGAPLQVQVVRQKDAALHPDEETLIDTATGPVTIREVVLWSGGRQRVVARTAFSDERLRRHPTILGLGTRPLGALLFADPNPCPFTLREVAVIGAEMAWMHDLIISHHAQPQPHYWGRRTLFMLFDAPILCTEVFLPELLQATVAPRP